MSCLPFIAFLDTWKFYLCPSVTPILHTNLSSFWARLQYCEKQLLASSCLSLSVRLPVCLPVRMEQLVSHGADIREI